MLLGLFAAPFVVGLIWRLLDRRAANRAPTSRRFWVRSAAAAACIGVALAALATHTEVLAVVALLGALVIAPTVWPPLEGSTFEEHP